MSKNTQEFSTRAVIESDYKDGVRYFGASSGIINPGRVAIEVFGDELEFGRLFAYCFRRFGHPNSGSDPYKDLAEYKLTTPMDGVFLSVCIKPTSRTGLLFGYVLAEDIEAELMRENSEILTGFHKRFEAWRKEQGIILPRDNPKYDPFAKGVDCRVDSDGQMAALKLYAENGGESIDDVRPGKKTAKVLDAIKAALEDLKTPVGVRDVMFSSVSDRVEMESLDDDDDDDPRKASRFHAAGYFFPSGYMQNPESFVRLSEKLRKIGNGSLSAGIEKFVSLTQAE